MMDNYTNILYQNTNLCLVDDELSCKNNNENLNDNKLITLIPNPIFEDLYLHDIKIGKILNNNSYFLPIQHYCVPKNYENECPFLSNNIYFIEKINYNLKQFYSNNDNILHIRKLYGKYIITNKNKIFNPDLLTNINSIDKLKTKILSVHNLFILKIFKDTLVAIQKMQQKRIIHKNLKPNNIYLTLNEIDITEINIPELLKQSPTTRIGDFKLAVQFPENPTIDDINTLFSINNYDYRYLPPELYIVNKLYASKLLKFYDFNNYLQQINIYEDFIHSNMDFLNYIKSWNTLTEINHQNILDAFKLNWNKIDIFSTGISFYKIIKIMNKNAIFFNDLNNLIENMINIHPEKRFNIQQCIDFVNNKLSEIINTQHITEKINEYYTPDMFLPENNQEVVNNIEPEENDEENNIIDPDDIIRERLENDPQQDIQKLVKGNFYKNKGGKKSMYNNFNIEPKIYSLVTGADTLPDNIEENSDKYIDKENIEEKNIEEKNIEEKNIDKDNIEENIDKDNYEGLLNQHNYMELFDDYIDSDIETEDEL